MMPSVVRRTARTAARRERPRWALQWAPRCAAALWLVLALTLGSGLGQGAPAAWAQSEYRLGSGDIVRVTVFGHEDLSGEFEVGASGGIPIPLVGEVAAAGLTVQELQGAITQALQPDYLKNPRVGVDVLNYRPFYIIGEVKTPGSYPYVSGMRVVNAVALAGGFTYRADEDDILITRASDPSGAKTPADPNSVVLPGDVIEVPERFF